MFAELLQFYFFRRIDLISGRYIIPIFTNSANKRDFNPLFSFGCHNIYLLSGNILPKIINIRHIGK
jgi:hypothetical protein